MSLSNSYHIEYVVFLHLQTLFIHNIAMGVKAYIFTNNADRFEKAQRTSLWHPNPTTHIVSGGASLPKENYVQNIILKLRYLSVRAHACMECLIVVCWCSGVGEIRFGTRDNLLTMRCLHGSVALCVCPFNLDTVRL